MQKNKKVADVPRALAKFRIHWLLLLRIRTDAGEALAGVIEAVLNLFRERV